MCWLSRMKPWRSSWDKLLTKSINCSMSYPRKMSYFELSPLLRKRVRPIPAVLHLFGSMSPSTYLRACYSWTCCKKSSRNWRKRIWLFGPRLVT
uniref:Trafficking kinesin protein 2 n=1 Tax=Myotis myotis TaxID=51298 RepID=A0A7J7WK45_MYOMY|nr:trafficking kinesin protein 2 [Myotis myotis]